MSTRHVDSILTFERYGCIPKLCALVPELGLGPCLPSLPLRLPFFLVTGRALVLLLAFSTAHLRREDLPSAICQSFLLCLSFPRPHRSPLFRGNGCDRCSPPPGSLKIEIMTSFLFLLTSRERETAFSLWLTSTRRCGCLTWICGGKGGCLYCFPHN